MDYVPAQSETQGTERTMPRWQKTVIGLFICFLMAVGIQQGLRYHHLREAIGQYAYASPGYGMRSIGKNGQYIGAILDTRWNVLPTQKNDVEGYQPRFLVARETIPGMTETVWLCTYLFTVKPEPPQKYKPSPFPPFQNNQQ